jgi:hypothetical protein
MLALVQRSLRYYALKKKILPKVKQTDTKATGASGEKEKMPTPLPVLPMPFPGIPKLTGFSILARQCSKVPTITTLSTQFDEAFKQFPSDGLEYPVQLSKLFQLFQQKHLLYRAFLKDFYESISTLLQDSDVNSRVFMLDGKSGIGKSVALFQLAHLLSTPISTPSNMISLIIYIPNLHQWTVGRYPYHPIDALKDMRSVEFDQPEISAQVLRSILSLNQNMLKSTPEGISLEQYIQDALKSPVDPHAVSETTKLLDRLIHGDLLQEISKNSIPKVICIVDQVNSIYSPLSYKMPNGEPISLDRFHVLRIIKKMLHGPSAVNLIITAPSYSDTTLKSINPSEFGLSGSDGLKWSITEIPILNQNEMSLILEYYRKLGYIYENNLDENSIYVKRKYYSTGGNPHSLFLACAYDNIYM